MAIFAAPLKALLHTTQEHGLSFKTSHVSLGLTKRIKSSALGTCSLLKIENERIVSFSEAHTSPFFQLQKSSVLVSAIFCCVNRSRMRYNNYRNIGTILKNVLLLLKTP